MTFKADVPDEGSWFRCFKRRHNKKKSITERLIDSNDHLTSTIEEQTRLIASVTAENGHYAYDLKDSKCQLAKVVEEKCNFEVAYKAVKDSLGRAKTKLQFTQNDLKAVNYQQRDLKAELEMLNKNKICMTSKIKEMEEDIRSKTDTVDNLTMENVNVTQTNQTLEKQLTITQNALAAETEKCMQLEKDFHSKTDKLEASDQLTKQLNQQLRELEQEFCTIKMTKDKLENELGAANECLKYEIVILSKALKKKREKILKLNEDKLLIMSYYQDKLSSNPDADCHQGTSIITYGATDTRRFQLVIPHADYLQNKILDLESRLYRQYQLTEELNDIIQGYNPDFSIQDMPELQIYLDSTIHTAYTADKVKHHTSPDDLDDIPSFQNAGRLYQIACQTEEDVFKLDGSFSTSTVHSESQSNLASDTEDVTLAAMTTSATPADNTADDNDRQVDTGLGAESVANINFKIDALLDKLLPN